MTQPLFTERFASGFAFCSWLDNRPPTACSRAELPWLSPTAMAQQGNVPAVLSVMPATATGSPRCCRAGVGAGVEHRRSRSASLS